MKDTVAWVIGWNTTKCAEQAKRLTQCGVPEVRTLTMYAHETEVYNYAMDQSIKDGFKYFFAVDWDVDILYPDFLKLMHDWMEVRSDVGLVKPNREGEEAWDARMPFPKYLEDGTALLYRLSVGARWDEELIFTQHADLDFGYEIKHRGFTTYTDPRRSVDHHKANYGEKQTFYHSYQARNHLLVATKWFKVGREKWQGLDWYNNTVSPAYRIPTMYELAAMSEADAHTFIESIHSEHEPILAEAGLPLPNILWKNPLWRGD